MKSKQQGEGREGKCRSGNVFEQDIKKTVDKGKSPKQEKHKRNIRQTQTRSQHAGQALLAADSSRLISICYYPRKKNPNLRQHHEPHQEWFPNFRRTQAKSSRLRVTRHK
jgi:hypothetical protein